MKKMVDGKVMDLTDEELREIQNAFPVSNEDVNREAARRIDQVCPLWKQVNLVRKKNDKDPAFALIDLIRDRSDALIGMNPIPRDFLDDKWWT